jgi:hypothetical protein
MLKSKESRDTLLMVFMALIIIAFFLYIFLPLGEKKEKTNPGKSPKTISTNTKKSPARFILPEETEPKEENVLDAFNQKLETQLTVLWADIMKTDTPFHRYDTENLKSLLLKSGNHLVEKLCKFSFFDLNDLARLEFPQTYSNSLKFNLFVSLFLIKIQEEFIEQAFASLPKVEVDKLVNFEVYNLLGQEIEKDYQLIPILFYFNHLLQGVNLYPTGDNTGFFRAGIENLRDLSASKALVKIREFLAFSQQNASYRIEWIEEDGIFGNDQKVYKNMPLKVFHFLKQDYLVFPTGSSGEYDQWVKELCLSDSRDIELEFLTFQNEDPSRQEKVLKIVYTPINTQFTVLLNENSPGMNEGLVDRMVRKQIEAFHKNFIIIDFSLEKTDPKLFKKELKQFGTHLKKNMPKERSLVHPLDHDNG